MVKCKTPEEAHHISSESEVLVPGLQRRPNLNVANARRAVMNVLTAKRDGKFGSMGSLKKAVTKNADADVSDSALQDAVDQLSSSGLLNKLSGGGVERAKK